MSNFTIEIKAPELVTALQALAAALSGSRTDKAGSPASKPVPVPAPAPAVAPQASQAAPAPAAPPTPVQPAPVPPTPAFMQAAPIQSFMAAHPGTQAAPPAPQATAPAVQAAPPVPPQPVVPTGTPQYTYEMLFNAAAALMQQDKGPQLQQLLQKYGIQRLPDLPKELYGAYATDLRALGGKL